jgi:hypothetical protein
MIRTSRNIGNSSKLTYKSFDYLGEKSNPNIGEEATLGPSFTKTREGKPFQIKRQSFLTQTTVIKDIQPTVPLVIPGVDRRGVGNNEIRRENFIRTQPKAREVIPFEKLQAMDTASQGIKIQFGDKTFKDLFNIREPDPTDVEWLNEKARLLATGLTEAQVAIRKPLGREQRTITKNVNLAEASKNVTQTLGDKLNVIDTALRQNRIETKQDTDAILAQVQQILADVANVDAFSRTELLNIKRVVDRLNLPKTIAEAGFTHRLWDRTEFTQQQGSIIMFILGKTPLADIQQPINVYPNSRWSLVSLFGNWRSGDSKQPGEDQNFPSQYLDLETNTIIPQGLAFQLAQQGIDNGMLSGKPVPVAPLNINIGGPPQPPQPPPGPPPGGPPGLPQPPPQPPQPPQPPRPLTPGGTPLPTTDAEVDAFQDVASLYVIANALAR